MSLVNRLSVMLSDGLQNSVCLLVELEVIADK